MTELDMDALRRAAEQDLGIVHRDGVRWYEAPLPWRWHRCRPWSSGNVLSSGGRLDRCACGGVQMDGDGVWIERNSRRKEKNR